MASKHTESPGGKSVEHLNDQKKNPDKIKLHNNCKVILKQAMN